MKNSGSPNQRPEGVAKTKYEEMTEEQLKEDVAKKFERSIRMLQDAAERHARGEVGIDPRTLDGFKPDTNAPKPRPKF